MEQKQILLDAATKIGKRICNQAIWNDGKCTWEITAPDMSSPKLKRGIKTLAGPTIYQGTSGIAIFLSELYKITRENLFLKTAHGAIQFALNKARKLPKNSFGFHNGRTGIGYSAFLLGSYSQNEDLMTEALVIIYAMKGHEHEDRGMDVIGGAGGAVQPLLKLYELTNEQALFEMSINLGESLIKKANMEVHGWSWGEGYHNYRNLCCYAHGAAGIGHAFLELYSQTNSDYYLYAAEQAFLYERQFYNLEIKNWLDFRYTELSEYISYNRIEELKEAIKNNTLLPYQIHYMSAWCHGAPGIGLSRLRAYKLTHNEIYKTEAVNSCENTIQSINTSMGNFSLCHGHMGNAETLLLGASILDNENYFVIAFNKALEGIEKFEKKKLPWPCGTMNSVSDPSLMLGEAGIGYFLLRLYNQNIPSVLCLVSQRKQTTDCELIKGKTFRSLQMNYVDKYFGMTFKLIRELKINDSSDVGNMSLSLGSQFSDVSKSLTYLEKLILNNKLDHNSMINDLYQLEKIKYFLSIGLIDHTEEYFYSINKDHHQNINWEDVIISISPFVILSEHKYNWNFFHIDMFSYLSDLKEKTTYYISFREANEIKSRTVTSFIYLLLKNLERKRTLTEIISILQEYVPDNTDNNYLMNILKQQLIELYNAGLIRVKPVCNYENSIIERITFDLKNKMDFFPQDVRNKFLIYQAISNYENVVKIDEELLMLFRIEEEMSTLFEILKQLQTDHLFFGFFELFSQKGVNKLEIYSALIERLKISFSDYNNLLVVNQ